MRTEQQEVYQYAVASGRIDPLFPAEVKMRQRKESHTYFLPADPNAIWGKDNEGNRVLVTRIETLLDTGELTLLKRTDTGIWYEEKPASSLELMRHLRAMNTQINAALNDAARFSLQARRDLVYKTLCQRVE